MAEVPKVHRVRTESLKVGETVERSEHTWASERTARKIAKDHLRENPHYYDGGKSGGTTEVSLTLNQNVRVKPAQKKKKQLPPQPKPMDWRTYGRELL